MCKPCLTSLFLALLLSDLAHAQHDPQRNATRFIAAGRLEKAKQELAQTDANNPESLFVRVMIALARNNVEAAVDQAQAALAAGLPFDRIVGGPRILFDKLHETSWFQSEYKQHGRPVLVHGPMVGAVTESGASFWGRTFGAADVQIRIGERLSEVTTTREESDFTAVLSIDGLEPATAYDYEVLINGEVVEAEATTFSTFPPQGRPAEFTVAFGGCAGYEPKWEYMWDTIASRNPLAMLMLGDNVYIDDPTHVLTQRYCYSRRQARPEWRRLTASTAMFAIYDDHDFATNDAVPGPKIEVPPWKREVWNVFRHNWVNPAYGGGTDQPGCWFDVMIGDVHFIMLDGRYYRDPESNSMLGAAQKEWLFETLENSEATFKVLASPVPFSPGVKPGSKDTWDGYPEEREEIFAFIAEQGIDGVFLIAGDRHRADLRKIDRPQSYDLYEFVDSKLTDHHTHPVVETPGLIWGYNKTCSFGLLHFDTTMEVPTVTMECVTIDGKAVRRFELSRDELTAK